MEYEPIYIVGPTAVGKSQIAHNVAKRLNGQIISMDAMQIYRGLDIGTAKPSVQDRKEILHHMIDIVDVHEYFHVGRFIEMAENCIQRIKHEGVISILVGGTGLYIKAMIDGLFQVPGRSMQDNVLDRLERRNRWLEFARIEGAEKLHAKLRSIDPKSAQDIHHNNVRRVIRALEVYEETGTPISQLQVQWSTAQKNVFMIGLKLGRGKLYKKINQRVEEMIDQGLMDEVKGLLKQGIEKNPVVMQAIGYKEFIAHLRGCYSFDEAVRLIKRNSRRFAKRQMTWFQKDHRIIWLDLDEVDALQIMNIISTKYREFTKRHRSNADH